MEERNDAKEKLEKEFAEALTEGRMEAMNPSSAAPERLTPRYEIREQTKADPIVEETRIIRKTVSEIDGRYDEYLSRVPGETSDTNKTP